MPHVALVLKKKPVLSFQLFFKLKKKKKTFFQTFWDFGITRKLIIIFSQPVANSTAELVVMVTTIKLTQ